jgi:hypothetical protein
MRTIANILGASLLAAVAGYVLFAKFIFQPMLRDDPAYSTEAVRRNCYPWNSAARPYLNDDPLGFRNSPGTTRTVDNVAGERWLAYFNFEGARVRSPQEQSESKKSSPIHIYGDSFGMAAEVNYEDGWFSGLGNLANFGTAGGAPDQALEYLKLNLAAGFRPQIVLLEMIPENVNRLWSIYRCLMYPTSGMGQVVKPHYEIDGKGVAQLISAPRVLTDWDSNVTKRDFWGTRTQTIETMKSSWALVGNFKTFAAHEGMLRDPHGFLMKRPETAVILRSILHQFSILAREYKFRPYLLLLPSSGSDIIDYVALGQNHVFAQLLSASCEGAGVAFINGFDIARDAFVNDTILWSILPNNVHMSIVANSVVGKGVKSALPLVSSED